MYYSEELVEEVRLKNDIVDVISGYIKLQKKGSSYFGLCPFHNEKTPSFSVSRLKQMYYCFGCGAGGNVFTFVMEYENYSFIEALKFLAERVGTELPEIEYSREAKEKADLKSRLLEVNKAAAAYFYAQLKQESGQAAYQYLLGRSLSQEIITQFGLGFSNKYSDDLYRYLKSKGYSDELIIKAGLASADERYGVHDKFWNRVMFPIMDINSKVIGFGGRVMGEGMPKYLNSPETPIFDKSRNLYGFHRARTTRKPYLLICEGYMDVIALHQAGFTNAVASLGTALTMGHARLISQRGFREVFLTYDSDDAGTKAAIRAVPILKDTGISAKIIRMEPYKDPDEFIKNMGAEAFETRIGDARNGFMFSLEVLEREFDLNSPEGKTSFLKEAARKLTEFDEEIERSNYIEAVAKAYQVSKDELRKLVNKVAIEAGQARPVNRPKVTLKQERVKEDGNLKSQKILLTWLGEDEYIFQQIRKYITPLDFTKELYRTVAEILYEQYQNGKVNPAQIMNHFTDEEEHREVAGLFHTKIREIKTPAEQEKALKETILRVKRFSIEEATRQLSPTDMVGLQKLMNAKHELQDLEKLHISVN
ncbi:MAG: DNA primase [Lachnospiraceae bacterium]